VRVHTGLLDVSSRFSVWNMHKMDIVMADYEKTLSASAQTMIVGLT
jgi:hypothetical protein